MICSTLIYSRTRKASTFLDTGKIHWASTTSASSESLFGRELQPGWKEFGRVKYTIRELGSTGSGDHRKQSTCSVGTKQRVQPRNSGGECWQYNRIRLISLNTTLNQITPGEKGAPKETKDLRQGLANYWQYEGKRSLSSVRLPVISVILQKASAKETEGKTADHMLKTGRSELTTNIVYYENYLEASHSPVEFYCISQASRCRRRGDWRTWLGKSPCQAFRSTGYVFGLPFS
jgi:hypothetical protein